MTYDENRISNLIDGGLKQQEELSAPSDTKSAEDVIRPYCWDNSGKGDWITTEKEALKAMRQFADQECEARDQEIAELKGDIEIMEKYPEHWHYQYNIASEKLFAANARINDLEEEVKEAYKKGGYDQSRRQESFDYLSSED